MKNKNWLLFFSFILFVVASKALASPLFTTNSTGFVTTGTQYIPGQKVGFQVTIDDTQTSGNISSTSCMFENDFRGTSANVSCSGNTTAYAYYYNLTGYTYTGAGTFTYRWYAANLTLTLGNGTWNKSEQYTYTISQNASVKTNQTIHTYTAGGTTASGSNGNVAGVQGQGDSWAECYVQPIDTRTGTAGLFRDDASWTSGPSGATSLGLGSYTVKCNSTGNTNYTSNSTGCSYTLTIISSGGGGGGGYTTTPTTTVTTGGPINIPGLPNWNIDPKIALVIIVIAIIVISKRRKK